MSEGEGFWAATLRAIMTSMALLARPSFPVRVFSDVDEGAAWLATLARSHDASELADAMRQMRGVTE